MFESAFRSVALVVCILSALFLTLCAGIFGGLLGGAAGWASLQLLGALSPETFVGFPYASWAVVLPMLGVFPGAVGGVFLLARFCWREAKSSDDAELQALASRIDGLWRFVNRRW